jgi:hypothetical protein
MDRLYSQIRVHSPLLAWSNRGVTVSHRPASPLRSEATFQGALPLAGPGTLSR